MGEKFISLLIFSIRTMYNGVYAVGELAVTNAAKNAMTALTTKNVFCLLFIFSPPLFFAVCFGEIINLSIVMRIAFNQF